MKSLVTDVTAVGFFVKHRVCEPPKEFTYNLMSAVMFLNVASSGHFSLLAKTS